MRLLLLLVVLGIAGCVTPFPADFDRNYAGTTVDEAAVNCLDWAWHKDHVNEVAGGVLKTRDGYACGELFVGTPLGVTSYAPRTGAARFHTHSLPNTQVSKQDMHNVREDPRHQPSYIRLRTGTVIAYECRDTKKGKVKCAGRRVR